MYKIQGHRFKRVKTYFSVTGTIARASTFSLQQQFKKFKKSINFKKFLIFV